MMENNKEKKSNILALKFKFFLYRFIGYFLFFLIPVFLPNFQTLSLWPKGILMCFYLLFMVGQWFLVGKGVDYVFKIYFPFYSSMNRFVYRVHLGMFFFFVYFNLLAPLTHLWKEYLFWMTWVVLGFFYSWPTKRKMAQESHKSFYFSEFKYLDGFEKTLLVLVLVMFIVSLPALPNTPYLGMMKQFYDPMGIFSHSFWNFLTVMYHPFLEFPEFLKIAWGFHFYFIGMGLYLLITYALFRIFLSRRLSLLGTFALASSWPVSLVLMNSPGGSLTNSYFILWIWAMLSVVKSSTGKAGLFIGLIGLWGSIISKPLAVLWIIQMAVLYYFFKDKTTWFKKIFFKYHLIGLLLIIIFLVFDSRSWNSSFIPFGALGLDNESFLLRKSLFVLAFMGPFILLSKLNKYTAAIMAPFKINMDVVGQLLVCCVAYCIFCLLFDPEMIRSFSLLWVVAFMGLLPVELLFQSMIRFRSMRNIVYFVYILFCLLDSRLEMRMKHFIQIFQ